jgi:hypothetical protein
MDTFTNPSQLLPGDIGPMVFYNPGDGPFKGNDGTKTTTTGLAGAGYTTINSGLVLDDWKRWNTIVTTYNTNKAAYDSLKDIYNTAVATQVKRNSNWFKQYF